MSVSTIDHQNNYYINISDACRFSTAGPIIMDSIRVLKGITNYYNLRPFVKNQGNTLTITNAKIRILCNNPWVSALNTNAVDLPVIAPGVVSGLTPGKQLITLNHSFLATSILRLKY